MVVLRPVRRAARVAVYTRCTPPPGRPLRATSRIRWCLDPPDYDAPDGGVALPVGHPPPCDRAAQPPSAAPIADVVGLSGAHGRAPGLIPVPAVSRSQLSFSSS